MQNGGSSSEYSFLAELGLQSTNDGCYNGREWRTDRGKSTLLTSVNPSSNQPIATIYQGTIDDYETCLQNMEQAKRIWAETPAPKRGEIVRQIGDNLRKKRDSLGRLLSLEMGKILSEGIGEVQEFIDVCDMACGMSRTINGQVLPSERKNHVIYENWNPLGSIGIISAFNFPCAVLGWNLAISLICGNTNIWKGASTTPLVTLAVSRIIVEVLEQTNVPSGVFTCIIGSGSTIGERLIHDNRINLVSFTGSTSIGQHVSEVVTKRFGRTILELGGNNASIILPDCDIDLALRSAVFGAVGTAGQRCTSLRRLLIHSDIYNDFTTRLIKAYQSIKSGDPLVPDTLLGPLHTRNAVKEYEEGIQQILKEGGKILYGGKVYTDRPGNYVEPTIVEIASTAEIIKTELFVPILYVIRINSLDEAITINNSVPQGLSSSLFTNNMKNVFQWMGPNGSDCGIVNVNAGTSGAEIGGAFGGEKQSSGNGSRESGSDSWKQYMRRSTCTVNYSDQLPLAQGVKFDV